MKKLIDIFVKRDKSANNSEKFDKCIYFNSIIEKAKKINIDQISLYIKKVLKLFESSKINEKKLKELVFEGVPDETSNLRPLLWKILLKYLPVEKIEWEFILKKERAQYKELKIEVYKNINKCEMIANSMIIKYVKNKNLNCNKDKLYTNTDYLLGYSKEVYTNTTDNFILNKGRFSVDYTVVEEFLNDQQNDDSSKAEIKNYLKICELLDDINKDIRRTKSNMHFLFLPSKNNTQEFNNENLGNIADKIRNDGYMDNESNSNFLYETHLDVLARILFIYAINHSETGYVQGMNELLIPIYYCFWKDNNPVFSPYLENDTYKCFSNLMDKIMEIYKRINSNEPVHGLRNRLDNLKVLLKMYDIELYDHFVKEKIDFELFCFRWYSLLLGQEFELPEILRLWDSLFSSDHILDFMNYLVLAIFKIKKHSIMKKKFCEIILDLKSLEKIDIEALVAIAKEIKKKMSNKKSNKSK